MRPQTCQRCLYTNNHPLGLIVDEEGICSGCRIHEEKDVIDWENRWNELELLIKPYRINDTRNYDCIVPVSGAGDSYFIVHVVKNLLKLRPLLVTHNRYYNTPLGIRNLANLRRKFNADILVQNINPIAVKSVIKTTLRKFGSFHWPAIAGQTCFPVQIAVSHQIPLIIWGAHQGVEQVGMFSHLHDVEMTRRYRKDHDLMGWEADDLLSNFDNLKEEHIWQYRYPDFGDLERVGVRGIYLSNYVRWDPLNQHLKMIKMYGYKSAKQNRTFDTYDNVDDWHYSDTHDYIKFLKHGYGKVVDHVSREIRHGRLSKTEGIKIATTYLSKKPRNTKLLLDWLGIDKEGFNFIIQQHSSYDIPEDDITEDDTFNHSLCSSFISNNALEWHIGSKHIIIGKGYPDSQKGALR